jgi:ketosteroid isomerase-like protein
MGGHFEGWREEIEAMDDLGNRVLVVTTQRGRGKGSGVEVEARWAALYEIEGGKITALTMYDGRAEALKAAGLSE